MSSDHPGQPERLPTGENPDTQVASSRAIGLQTAGTTHAIHTMRTDLPFVQKEESQGIAAPPSYTQRGRLLRRNLIAQQETTFGCRGHARLRTDQSCPCSLQCQESLTV